MVRRQASAALTARILDSAALGAAARLYIVGAGPGQFLDYLDPALLRPFDITCTDLNSTYLDRLRERFHQHGIRVATVIDDLEQTNLAPSPDLILVTLVLEHIDWRRGVDALCGLRPRLCAVITQENPPDMTSAVTPGRVLPPSLAKAVETAHAVLVPRDALLEAFAAHHYRPAHTFTADVADGKRLVATLLCASS